MNRTHELISNWAAGGLRSWLFWIIGDCRPEILMSLAIAHFSLVFRQFISVQLARVSPGLLPGRALRATARIVPTRLQG
jgi:hypothetical protein